MNFIFITLVFNLWVKAVLAPDSQAVMINWSVDKGTEEIVLAFIHKGNEYIVFRKPNQYPGKEWRDDFIWYSKSKWHGGDLKLTAVNKNKTDEFFISEKDIAIKDFGVRRDKEVYYINPSLVKTFENEDRYAWRMVGYDPQNTGYYPFPLYSPLRFKWRSPWSGWDNMISGCAAHQMLFVGDGGNHTVVFDLETGDTIWCRMTTSNTMTCALSTGDSVLFVGSLIGFNPDTDTSFYALNPYTGDVKWGKALTTVEFSPIVIDSFVYVGSLGLPTIIFAFNLNGDLLWSHMAGRWFHSPTYWEGKVYHTAGELNDSLRARNFINGELLWEFKAPSDINYLTICNEKVFFFSYDTLFAIDANNGIFIQKKAWLRLWGLHAFNDKLLFSHGEYGVGDTIFTRAYSMSAQSCSIIWDKILRPRGIDKGRTSFPITTNNVNVWITNLDFIYLLNADSGYLVNQTDLPSTNTWEPSFFLPIAYRNYFIGGHREFFYVYEGDTAPAIAENNAHPEITQPIRFYSYSDFRNIFFHFFLPYDDIISIKLFNIRGGLCGNIYNGSFLKGEHIIRFNPGYLSSGIYFAILKTSNLKKIIKIPFVR
jgi:outer membrane protein assembly factor BamB